MPQTLWSQMDLVKFAKHPKTQVRRWACERMRTLYGHSGIGILETLLRDKEKGVLIEALEYLENYPDPKFNPLLLNLYETHHGLIAGRSAFILGKLKETKLISAFKKKNLFHRIEFDEILWTIRALGELANNEAREILKGMLSETDEKSDPLLTQAIIQAMIVANEDLHVILHHYAHFYKNLSMEILQPLLSLCGLWFSIEELKEEKTKFFRKKKNPVVMEILDYLKERGFTSLAKEFQQRFFKQNYSSVIELTWSEAERKVYQRLKENDIDQEDPYIQRSIRILKSFNEYLQWGPGDSLKDMAVISLILFSKLIESENLIGIKTDLMDEESLILILFEDRDSAGIDDQLMERLLCLLPPETVFERSIEQMKKDPFSFGTVRAIKLLGRLKKKEAIPHLIDFLNQKANDMVLDECINSLTQIGHPLIEYLATHFDQLNEDQKTELLFVLRDIPEEETADLLLRNWDELWGYDKEVFLHTLEGVASKRFIAPLRDELREGETLEEETFYLLCHIHGVKDLLLPKIEKRINEKEKETEESLKNLESKNLRSMLRKPLKIELKCRQCGKPYFYEVENIYVNKKKPMIGDKVVCKNCKAINQYEITKKGNLALFSYMTLLTAAKDQEIIQPEELPVKFVSTGLMDGRTMSLDEILKYYEGEIKKSPEDPALRIGYANVLFRTGREKEAVFQYHEALRMDPMAVEAYGSLGEYEADKGNVPQAYEYYKKAFEYIHTGHYYRTKDPDQLKEAIFFNLEHFEKLLGKEKGKMPEPSLPGLVKKGKVGRNDPCPCGSGKKYKKCCLNKIESKETQKTSVTPLERDLRDRLLAFSRKEKYKKDLYNAYELFFRKPFEEPLVMDNQGIEEFSIFLEWFIHDFPLSNGFTLAEEFYHEKKEKLSEEEKTFLKSEIASHMSLYEVLSVNPGKGLRLKDLITGEELDVFEVRGSFSAVKWDVLFARVLRTEGVNKFSGNATLLPPHLKKEILSSIIKIWEKFKNETGQLEWSSFIKSNAHLIYHLIEDQSLIEPVFVTEEYHKIYSANAIFDIKDFEGVRYRLEKEFDFLLEEEKEEEILFTWLKRGPSKYWELGNPPKGAIILKSQMIGGRGELRWTALGTITLTPKRLHLWCLSRERLERGKRRLIELLGEYVKHRFDTFEDLVKMAREHPGEELLSREEENTEKLFPLLQKTMEEFAIQWLDEKIPALGGKTPREAVKTLEGRQQVEELLKDFENREERKRRAGEPYIDVHRLRKLLNL